jgi:hypothetical protein
MISHDRGTYRQRAKETPSKIFVVEHNKNG